MAYSKQVLDHYENPRNVGKMDMNDPTVGTGMVGAPACGDVMKLQIKIEEGVITDAKRHDISRSRIHPEHGNSRRTRITTSKDTLFSIGGRCNQICNKRLPIKKPSTSLNTLK